MPDVAPYFTPQSIAAHLGLSKVDVVLAWIRRGELRAMNVGNRPDGRPTWRISGEDLERFLASRQATPTPAPTTKRPRRRKPAAKVTRYF